MCVGGGGGGGGVCILIERSDIRSSQQCLEHLQANGICSLQTSLGQLKP